MQHSTYGTFHSSCTHAFPQNVNKHHSGEIIVTGYPFLIVSLIYHLVHILRHDSNGAIIYCNWCNIEALIQLGVVLRPIAIYGRLQCQMACPSRPTETFARALCIRRYWQIQNCFMFHRNVILWASGWQPVAAYPFSWKCIILSKTAPRPSICIVSYTNEKCQFM